MVPLLGLVVSLLSLVLLGTIDAVDSNINGMLLMCPYRAVLNLLVVSASAVFFFAVVAVVRARHAWLRRREQALAANTGSTVGGAASDTNAGDPAGAGPHAGRRALSATTQQHAARALWFLLAAVCDTVALYVSMLASNAVTSSLRPVLQQGTIPFSMVASFALLGRRYGWGHIVSAVLIMGGIVTCLASVLLSSSQTSDPAWGLVYTLSCVPQAAGACLKEWLMTHRKRPADIHTVNAATVGYQLVLSVLLYPVAVVIQDAPGAAVCLPDNATSAHHNHTAGAIFNVTEMLQNLKEGVMCGMAGVDSAPTATAESAEDCHYAALTTWLAIVTICACVRVVCGFRFVPPGCHRLLCKRAHMAVPR